MNDDLAALIHRHTVAGGFANTIAIAEEAFEMGKRAASPVAPDGKDGSCVLCKGVCRGHSLGHPEEWEPEVGSAAASDRDIEMRARARDVVREVVGLRMRNDAHISFEDAVSACLAFAATSAATADGVGFVYWNPDAGEEYASSHPIDSGECVEAENIRRSTGQEDALHAAFQEQWQKAAALSASPLPGREEIARERLALCAGYEISRHDVDQGCSVLAKDAIRAMLQFAERLSLSTPPTEG